MHTLSLYTLQYRTFPPTSSPYASFLSQTLPFLEKRILATIALYQVTAISWKPSTHWSSSLPTNTSIHVHNKTKNVHIKTQINEPYTNAISKLMTFSNN